MEESALGENELHFPACPVLEETGSKARLPATFEGLGWEDPIISPLCTCFSPAGLGKFYAKELRPVDGSCVLDFSVAATAQKAAALKSIYKPRLDSRFTSVSDPNDFYHKGKSAVQMRNVR